MTHDRWTTGEVELTNALRVLYAAPGDERYWDALESRILAHVARADERGVWYGEMADMVRPGLLAAAGLILVASMAIFHSRQVEARSAYASVISPATAIEPTVRGGSSGDGEAAIHFILSH